MKVEVAFAVLVIAPERLSDVKVPTDVSDELTTDEPSVVAERVWASLMSTTPLAARFTFPPLPNVSPPAKVEVAVVPVRFKYVAESPPLNVDVEV